MHYLEGTIFLHLLVQKFLDLRILKNYIEMTKTLELFRQFVLQKQLRMIMMCFMNSYLRKVSLDLLVKEAHGSGLMGHFGINKIYNMLHEHLFWAKMKHDVHKLVNALNAKKLNLDHNQMDCTLV